MVNLAKVKEVFVGAMSCQSSSEREQYLIRECSNDSELRHEVNELLVAHTSGTCFLDDCFPADSVETVAHLNLESIEIEGQQVGPYKILELLGSGGMGSVYVADQLKPVKRKVALKIIKLGMDSKQFVARFEAERQILALMDHPNIAKVFDAGTSENGRPYFAMELVRGIPITDFCDSKNLPLTERLRLFSQVCLAVQHAHLKGIIHRDIKPSNILVTLHDDIAVPKVIDFGIAKVTNGQLVDKTIYTAFAQMIGTPLYMSPEQAEMNSLDVDTRSDVYSLGVLLYELMIGTTPFDSDTLKRATFDEMRRIIKEVDPPKPSDRLSKLNQSVRTTISKSRGIEAEKLSQTLKGELDWIVMKCLEKNRTRRYQSSSALGADIERFLNHLPVEACPRSFFYLCAKAMRRNRRVLVPSLLVLIAMVVGIVVSAGQAWRAIVAERIATKNLLIAVEQREKADESFRVAIESVNRMVNVLGTDAVKEIPIFNETRGVLLKDAIGMYDRIIEIDPTGTDVYRQRANAYFLLSMRRKAIPDWRRVLQDDKDDHATMFQLAHQLWHYEGQYDEALKLLRRAIELKPDSLDYRAEEAAAIRRKDPIRAKIMLDEIICESPVYLALRYRGDLNIAIGQYEAAIEDGRQASLVRPDAQTGWTIMGTGLERLGRNEEALVAYSDGIHARPQIHWAYKMKVNLLLKLSRFQEASELCEVWLKLTPSLVSAHSAAAYAWCRLGRFEKAYEHLRQIVQSHPHEEDSPGAVESVASQIGKCVKHWPSDHTLFPDVLGLCGQLISREPNCRNAIARSIVATETPSPSAAQYACGLFEASLKTSEHDFQDWSVLGTAYQQCGQFALAQAMFVKAAEMNDREFAINYFQAAIAAYDAGEIEKATVLFKAAESEMQKGDQLNAEQIQKVARAKLQVGTVSESHSSAKELNTSADAAKE